MAVSSSDALRVVGRQFRRRGPSVLLASTLMVAVASGQTVVFEDDLDDNSAGWVFSALSNDVLGFTGSLSTFGFDYSELGIPEAPNTQPGDLPTSGLTLQTNALGFGEDQAGVTLTDPAFSGAYTVQVDLWMNWAADDELIGTTEHGGLFVGSDTDENPADPEFPVQQGAGAIVSTDGDCTNCDFILLQNRAELDTFSGQYAVSDFGFGNQPGFDNTDVNTDPENGAALDLPALFPSFNISEATGGLQGTPTTLEQPAGAVGFQWITLTAEVDPTGGAGDGPELGTATFSITVAETGETFTLGTVDNSIEDIRDDDFDGDECQPTAEDPASEDICTEEVPVDLEGQITLALIDFFPSVASDINLAFALFDNVLVTAGLPGDFNGDGVVDAADYTVWRDGLDAGEFSPEDFDTWVENFGAGEPAASAAAVPEPSTFAIAGVAAATLWARRRALKRA